MATGLHGRLLDGLDEAQRAAVTHDADAIRVIAPPGSGKTRVLTRRVAWRAADGVDARRMVVVTFTRRAADELRGRLARLGVRGPTIGTFHAVALEQLTRRAEDKGRRAPRVLASPEPALEDLAPDEGRDTHELLRRTLAWAGARGLDADDLADGSLPPTAELLGPERCRAVLRDYAAWKARRGLLDFDDLIRAWTVALNDDPVFGRAQRWRAQEVLVDEFQDVNPTQSAALDALLADGGRRFVVGDPDQAIYGFNGADRDLLLGLPDRVPGMATIELTTTYRCPQLVVDAASELVGRPAPRSSHGSGSGPLVRSVGDEAGEAATILAVVDDRLAGGGALSDVAVLVRTRAAAAALRDRLSGMGLATSAVPATPAAPAVCVTTLHAAKGLEWPVVVLTGIEDGTLPHRSAAGPAEVAEERRLLYVGLTRAAERVEVLWAERRRHRSGEVRSGPSPFLEALPSGTGAAPAAAPNAPWRADLERARAALGPDGAPRRRVDALRRWRTAVAEAGRCAPEAVLDDRRLTELGTDPPRDLAELVTRTGWGPASIDRLGPGLLDALAEA